VWAVRAAEAPSHPAHAAATARIIVARASPRFVIHNVGSVALTGVRTPCYTNYNSHAGFEI